MLERSAPETAGEVRALRRFNRMYTRLLGTLEEGMHHTKYNLAEARVIYELATRTEPKATDVAEALAMDPGYLSRILTKLENAALLKRKVSKQDSRCSHLTLTSKGRAAFHTLNKESNKQAGAILASLPPSERTQLIQSIRTIEDILANDGPEHPPYVLRPHRPGDMGWVVHREGAFYAEEFGWDDTFEALAARIVADFVTDFDAKRERCWIAEIDGQPAGHVFLVKHPDQPDTAKLRLLFVERSARGKGLGNVLVNECIRFANTCGYKRITLWTQSILAAAHRIYERSGFRLVKEEPHHSFGADLVGQTWELDLGQSGRQGCPNQTAY
jgi:DNA-binding MarR family transcriptional regulator/GNAT superfamily N-acetyltransferase